MVYKATSDYFRYCFNCDRLLPISNFGWSTNYKNGVLQTRARQAQCLKCGHIKRTAVRRRKLEMLALKTMTPRNTSSAMPGYKVCADCGCDKPLRHYSINSKGWVSNRCYDCKNALVREKRKIERRERYGIATPPLD